MGKRDLRSCYVFITVMLGTGFTFVRDMYPFGEIHICFKRVGCCYICLFSYVIWQIISVKQIDNIYCKEQLCQGES